MPHVQGSAPERAVALALTLIPRASPPVCCS